MSGSCGTRICRTAHRQPGRLTGDPDAPQGRGRRGVRGLVTSLTWMVFIVCVAGPAAGNDGATTPALEIAHGRELNARAHYLAYAAGAEREGLFSIACLFRVVARAESIHAGRAETSLQRLGGRPDWTLESVAVRSTAANLETSIALEGNERDVVYPRFAGYAREELDYDALYTFNDARAAEGTHAAIFAAALAGLERSPCSPPIALASLRAGSAADPPECEASYFLCPGDGSVFASPVARSCPNCGTRASRILRFTSQPGPQGRSEDGPRPLASR